MTSISNAAVPVEPWYRHRWPWILMAGPFIVVVASFVTLWLAIRTDDGLVTDDYYKKGLAINQTLKLSERATELGLQAGLMISLDSITLRLSAAAPGFVPPASVRVTVSHPTRAGLDQSRVLTREGAIYSGEVRLPAAGHWLVLLEDERHAWRLLGNVILPANEEALIGAVQDKTKPEPADIRN